MLSRENILHCKALDDRMKDIFPMLDVRGSDSARLDNTLEFMTMSGMDLPLAVMMTIPEPWQHIPTMSREKRAFYQYYANHDGTVGRSGFDHFLRRRRHGCSTGQKWSASVPLLCDR
jgi:Glutamate synthase domain 1